MMGCTRRQLLWQVQMPAARSLLLVGLNQGIMQTLAMIVLAALIGASGLGSELLTSLQSLRLGEALEQGVAIVVIAVVRSEEHTSELQSLMRISYAVFCLKKKK